MPRGDGRPGHDGLAFALCAELNEVRADPAAYARKLAATRELEGEAALAARCAPEEGPKALEDAIAALAAAAPAPPLAPKAGMDQAARDTADALRRSAAADADGLGEGAAEAAGDGAGVAERLARYGVFFARADEIVVPRCAPPAKATSGGDLSLIHI